MQESPAPNESHHPGEPRAVTPIPDVQVRDTGADDEVDDEVGEGDEDDVPDNAAHLDGENGDDPPHLSPQHPLLEPSGKSHFTYLIVIPSETSSSQHSFFFGG